MWSDIVSEMIDVLEIFNICGYILYKFVKVRYFGKGIFLSIYKWSIWKEKGRLIVVLYNL